MGNSERKFKADDLSEYDGRNGRRAYVACGGNVYDITDSISWEDGEHYDNHLAGRDLTDEMDSAPHGEDMLTQFPIVGRYE